MMIYTVTLNPAFDKTAEIADFSLNTVNRICKFRTDPGGKGINVSKVIKSLGGDSVATGILAGHAGQAIFTALQLQGLTCDFVFADGETRTNLKIVDLENGTNTDINEPGPAFCNDTVKKVMTRLENRIHPGDVVVLAGSLPAGAPPDTYLTLCARCKAAGAKVFLDADGEQLFEGIKSAPYLIKPNKDELSRISGRRLETDDELICAAREIINSGVEKVIVTLGKDGALYIDSNSVYRADGLSVTVGSTVGAGDSVVAALALAYERKLSAEQTIRLSTATGAANVMCSGTQAAEYSVIEKLIPKVSYRKL